MMLPLHALEVFNLAQVLLIIDLHMGIDIYKHMGMDIEKIFTYIHDQTKREINPSMISVYV